MIESFCNKIIILPRTENSCNIKIDFQVLFSDKNEIKKLYYFISETMDNNLKINLDEIIKNIIPECFDPNLFKENCHSHTYLDTLSEFLTLCLRENNRKELCDKGKFN